MADAEEPAALAYIEKTLAESTELARQYAEGAIHNRKINKGRERLRSIVGIAALASVAMTVFLLATTYADYLTTHEKDVSHAAP